MIQDNPLYLSGEADLYYQRPIPQTCQTLENLPTTRQTAVSTRLSGGARRCGRPKAIPTLLFQTQAHLSVAARYYIGLERRWHGNWWRGISSSHRGFNSPLWRPRSSSIEERIKEPPIFPQCWHNTIVSVGRRRSSMLSQEIIVGSESARSFQASAGVEKIARNDTPTLIGDER